MATAQTPVNGAKPSTPSVVGGTLGVALEDIRVVTQARLMELEAAADHLRDILKAISSNGHSVKVLTSTIKPPTPPAAHLQPRKKPTWSAARRKAMSVKMKARWAAEKAGVAAAE